MKEDFVSALVGQILRPVLNPRACGSALMDSVSSELFVTGGVVEWSADLVWGPGLCLDCQTPTCPRTSESGPQRARTHPRLSAEGARLAGAAGPGPWAGPVFRNCSAIGQEAPKEA